MRDCSVGMFFGGFSAKTVDHVRVSMAVSCNTMASVDACRGGRARGVWAR